MASKCSTRRILLTIANILIPLSLITFATGFFPYKPFLSGLAQYEDLGQGGLPPVAPFDKVVFMVVDALRSDFVYSNESAMLFTQSLIREGSALPYTAYAAAPTITMPRVKAITTGSIPSFLDLILNFAESDTSSSLATQDTWLAQMKNKGTGKQVMYGDDTWLKLFPGVFDRSEGTSSFFVADFTEVDNNVTRHVVPELQNSDWNTMILHYLGLDHIGHKAGPKSPNMLPKQVEMDNIVQTIYTAISTHSHLRNTLLVLAGDHGMTNSGNHGGSSAGETSPALVFLSPKLRNLPTYGKESPLPAREDFHFYERIEQSDIAPTLAALLGFPVPRNNLGCLIPVFQLLWPDMRDKLKLLLGNARQILTIVKASAAAGKFDRVEACKRGEEGMDRLACDWANVNLLLSRFGKESPVLLFDALMAWSRSAQELMSRAASNYSMPSLLIATALAFVGTLVSFFISWPTLKNDKTSSALFGLVATLYCLMMFASSYVEEEHNFWYWMTSIYLSLLFLKTVPKSRTTATSVVVAIVLLRTVRRYNQTGQKFAGAPDIAHSFLSKHTTLVWALVLGTYLWNCLSLNSGFPHAPKQFSKAGSQALLLLAFTFKLAFTHEDAPEMLDWISLKVYGVIGDFELVQRARLLYAAIGAAVVYAVGAEIMAETKRHRVASINTLHNLIVLILLTQTKTVNIPLIGLFSAIYHLLSLLDLSIVQVTTLSLLLQYTSFFALGGTNSISSIDLSLAYNGISGYNAILVGVLLFITNWAGPVFFASATTRSLLGLYFDGDKEVFGKYVGLVTLWTLSGCSAVMAACVAMRTHLFVWTVFSPKFLYQAAWAVGVHLGVNVGLVSLLFWLGRRVGKTSVVEEAKVKAPMGAAMEETAPQAVAAAEDGKKPLVKAEKIEGVDAEAKAKKL